MPRPRPAPGNKSWEFRQFVLLLLAFLTIVPTVGGVMWMMQTSLDLIHRVNQLEMNGQYQERVNFSLWLTLGRVAGELILTREELEETEESLRKERGWRRALQVALEESETKREEQQRRNDELVDTNQAQLELITTLKEELARFVIRNYGKEDDERVFPELREGRATAGDVIHNLANQVCEGRLFRARCEDAVWEAADRYRGKINACLDVGDGVIAKEIDERSGVPANSFPLWQDWYGIHCDLTLADPSVGFGNN